MKVSSRTPPRNGNGNGQWDSDTETKTTSDYTDTGIEDSLNERYDDVDLDGDGMVGRIEKSLDKDPLTLDNPLSLRPVSLGLWGDIAGFELDDINYEDLDPVGELDFVVDGISASLQDCVAAGDGHCLLRWNTPYEPPGAHVVWTTLTIHDAAYPGHVISAPGPLLTYDSDNVVQFDETYSLFNANGATFYAMLPQYEATYTINIYDPSNPSEPIKTIENQHTYDGTIQVDWDLNYTDGGGHQVTYAEDAMDVEYDVTMSDPPSSGSNKQKLNEGASSLPNRNFVIAHIATTSSQTETEIQRNIVQAMIVDLLLAHRSGVEAYYSADASFNDFTSPNDISGKSGFVPDMTTVQQKLFPCLENVESGNFYYTGHGSPNRLSLCVPRRLYNGQDERLGACLWHTRFPADL